MKKYFLLFFVMLVFAFSSDVCATSTGSTTESSDSDYTASSSGMNGDKTWVKEGHFQSSYTYRFFNTSNNLYGNYSQLEFAEVSVEEGYVYIVFKEEPFVNSSQIENTHWGYYLCGKGVATVKYFLKNQNVDGTYNERTLTDTITLNSNDDTGGYSLFSVIWEEEDVGKMEDLQLDYNTKPIIDSDIPIFDIDDVEGYHKYEESGDWSSAENAPDYTDDYDDTIPLPHNFRVVSGNKQAVTGLDVYPVAFSKDIVLAWDQDDVVDDLVSDIEVSFTSIRLKDGSVELSEHTSTYYDLVKDVAYNGTPSMTVKASASQLNGLREKGYMSKVTFRIRNKIGNKTSNWVRVTLDLKTGKASATEESYDDETDTGGDEYNDDTVSPPDDANGNVSIDGIMGYIRSGFGLLGDTGIIALMSQCFLYLPANVWSIIYFYLSMVVAIALFAVFVKVVF